MFWLHCLVRRELAICRRPQFGEMVGSRAKSNSAIKLGGKDSKREILIKALEHHSTAKYPRCIDEWDVVEYVTEKTGVRCVCTHPNCIYVHRIRNQTTASQLYPIGSVCVKLISGEETVKGRLEAQAFGLQTEEEQRIKDEKVGEMQCHFPKHMDEPWKMVVEDDPAYCSWLLKNKIKMSAKLTGFLYRQLKISDVELDEARAAWEQKQQQAKEARETRKIKRMETKEKEREELLSQAERKQEEIRLQAEALEQEQQQAKEVAVKIARVACTFPKHKGVLWGDVVLNDPEYCKQLLGNRAMHTPQALRVLYDLHTETDSAYKMPDGKMRICGGDCKRHLAVSEFSRSQLRKKERARCKQCIQA